MIEPLIGVVAIVYRQSDSELASFLRAVGRFSYRRRQVYLVDNEAGRDFTVLSAETDQSFEVLDGGGNGGFTGGANVGIRAALDAGCDRVLLLNTDVIFLRDDLIERLGEAFSGDPACGMVCPVIVQAPRTDRIWYRGAVMGRWSWIPRHPGINHTYRRPRRVTPRRTSIICGCCVLIDKEVIARVGGLDEDLFSYFDDSDLSLRATRAGFHLYLWPEALLAHQKDGRRLSAIETYYFGRNPFVLMRKHAAPGTWLVGLLAQLCVALPATLARAATPQARMEAWRGTLHGLRVLATGRPVGMGHRESLHIGEPVGVNSSHATEVQPAAAEQTNPGPLPGRPGSEMITVERCDLCGTSSCKDLMKTRDRLFGLPGDFALIRCKSCGLVRLSPRPAQAALASYYPDDGYYAYASGDGLPRYQRAVVALLGPIRRGLQGVALGPLGYSGSPAPSLGRSLVLTGLRRSLLLQRVAGYTWEVPPFVAGGRALDIGCGNGRYLASLAALGWEVLGVDESPMAAQVAMESYRIPVHVGTVESGPFEPGSFDFIHMRHVLEHLDSPVSSLKSVHELLRPGGWLYVETPNLDSYAARAFGRLWFAIESPRHLWLFDTSTLSGALDSAGFETIRMWTFVMIRLCSWASTYRREEQLGRMLLSRPSIGWHDLWSATTRGALARARVHLDRNSGDIMACWARKPG